MYRTLVSKATSLVAGAALASAFFAFNAAPALGASITITADSCPSFTTSGSGSALVVTCGGGGGGQSCSISSTAGTSMSLNVPTTLTVSCNGSPNQWYWTASGQNSGSCPAAVNTGYGQMPISGAGTAVSNCVYNANVYGGLGDASANIALSWTAAGGSAPTGCTLTPASQTVTAGGLASLSAQCSGGAFPITHTLSSNGAFNGQSATQTSAGVPAVFSATVSAATTVSGVANNGQSVSDGSASISIGGGGGGGTFANCTRQGYTAIPGAGLPLSFVSSQGGSSSSSGTFGDTQAWVFTLTVPANTTSTSAVGQFQVAEFGSSPTPRHVVVSKTPCDFDRLGDYTGANGPVAVCRNGTTCAVTFQVGTGTPFGDTGWLQPGTYYISVRNYSDFPLPNGHPSCGPSNCTATYNYQPTH